MTEDAVDGGIEGATNKLVMDEPVFLLNAGLGAIDDGGKNSEDMPVLVVAAPDVSTFEGAGRDTLFGASTRQSVDNSSKLSMREFPANERACNVVQ